ncbi:MAG TPA: hypothetical protein VHC63_09295 [Acidimicrobiales bacterium]|nr:hypothetical protein [Acidimicrobiales bacterium]
MADRTQQGQAAAFGKPNVLDTKLRKYFHAGFKRLAVPEHRANIDALVFEPAPRDAAELADLVARINWYLADATVPIYIAGADHMAFSPADAPHMDPDLVQRDRIASGPLPTGRGVRHVLHRIAVGSVARVLPHIRSMSIADPVFAYTSELGYLRLRAALAPEPPPDPLSTVPRLLARRVTGGRALALGTGPSASELDPARVTADVRIVCNSAVRDIDLITKLRPDVICFADPVFHFGPSRYAAAFRADLRGALAVCDALVVIPARYAGLLLAHMPDVRDRLVTLDDTGTEWAWPTETNAKVVMSGNVLTYLMLPVAFALVDEVDVGGCDGRVQTENYFWKHNAQLQYSQELMNDVFAAHPAFFRTTSYTNYYDRHLRYLDEFLAVGEAAGKHVHGVTRSHIPALIARGAPRFD